MFVKSQLAPITLASYFVPYSGVASSLFRYSVCYLDLYTIFNSIFDYNLQSVLGTS